jgi:AcrR family transcriptional regulator
MTETWRATEKASRRALYLTAAARLFAEHGYNGVSIDDLGMAAGVSGPALYRHFPGKEAILTELLVTASERLMTGCEAILAQSTPGFETLRGLVDFHIDFALAERDVIRIQDRELARLPADVNHRVRATQRRYVQAWSEVVAAVRPEFAPTDIDVRVLGVFGLLNTTPYSARDENGVRVRALFAEMALASLVRALDGSTI